METETKPDAPVEAERPPLYAEVKGVGVDCTVISIHMFDKAIQFPITGRDHEDRARAEVDSINTMFERELYTVRQTAATIMQLFVSYLREGGVAEDLVDEAFARLRSNVGA